MKLSRRSLRRTVVNTAVAGVASAAVLLAHGLVTASPAQAECVTPYVRVTVSNQDGDIIPNRFIDTSFSGDSIQITAADVAAGNGFVAHSGVVFAGSQATFRYPQPTWTTRPARDNNVIHHEDEVMSVSTFRGTFNVTADFTDCNGNRRTNVPVGTVFGQPL